MPVCSGELRIAPLRDKNRDSGKGKKDTKGRISGGGWGKWEEVGGRGGAERREGTDGGLGGGGRGGAKEKRKLSLRPPGYYL